MYLPRRVLRGGRFHAIRKQSCLVEVDVVGKHRALSVWGLVADKWAAYCAKEALASRRQHAPLSNASAKTIAHRRLHPLHATWSAMDSR